MTSQEVSVDLFIIRKNERFHVMLRHADGTEELSQQSFDTRQECEQALEQYIQDRGMNVMRVQ